ncbi:hypothetical protein [Bacteroides pyogenes]|uniref:hypothetical protein n=1 Tax=Bacteroides pyogenes TaxID=310300 RepID=UPI002012B7B6|nr:hypothetical protein [Bacteroides pyogenes]
MNLLTAESVNAEYTLLYTSAVNMNLLTAESVNAEYALLYTSAVNMNLLRGVRGLPRGLRADSGIKCCRMPVPLPQTRRRKNRKGKTTDKDAS